MTGGYLALMKVRKEGVARFLAAPAELTSGKTRNEYFNAAFKAEMVDTRVVAAFFVNSRGIRRLVSVREPSEEEWTRDGFQRVNYPDYSGTFTALTKTRKFEQMIEDEAEVEAEVEVEDGWVNGYWVNPDHLRVLNAAVKLSKRRPVNVTVVGPSGYGKTTMAEAVAFMNGMKYVRINCAGVRDPEEWFGYREAVDGSTLFVPTEFSRAVIEGNAVIVLDEFNRVEPWLHNTLFPLLDHARKTVVHGTEIACGSNVVFVMTMNLGYQFTGTFTADAALTNRSDITLHCEALPENVERDLLRQRSGIASDLAAQIVRVMSAMRKLADNGGLTADVSTRTSLKVADLVSVGLNLDEAIANAVFSTIDRDELKAAVDAANSIAR
jgi:MoxR-like ATPase